MADILDGEMTDAADNGINQLHFGSDPSGRHPNLDSGQARNLDPNPGLPLKPFDLLYFFMQ